MKKGICVLKCKDCHIHGHVILEEHKDYVLMDIYVVNISEGYHGIHIHKSGNEMNAPESFLDHFTVEPHYHGDLNHLMSHDGDLGNIFVSKVYSGDTYIYEGYKKIKSMKLRLTGENTIFGRSIIVHEKVDDLGKGKHKDSLKTGNSGGRLLWGIIGQNP